MARYKDREKALILREQGKSYSQIKTELGLSKSTLSGWLRDYPLSQERIRELRDWNAQRIERFRTTMRKKRQDRLDRVYQEQQKAIFPITKRELYLAGLFLYWGEGGKTNNGTVTISNTDPAMMKVAVKWLTHCMRVPKEKIKVRLQLYRNMDTNQEMRYWERMLCIPRDQFRNPQIKNTTTKHINHKGVFGHGTCEVIVHEMRLNEHILVSLQTIRDDHLVR